MKMKVHAAIDKMLDAQAMPATNSAGRHVHHTSMMVLLALGRVTLLSNHIFPFACIASPCSLSAGLGCVHDPATSSVLLDYYVDVFATPAVAQSYYTYHKPLRRLQHSYGL